MNCPSQSSRFDHLGYIRFYSSDTLRHFFGSVSFFLCWLLTFLYSLALLIFAFFLSSIFQIIVSVIHGFTGDISILPISLFRISNCFVRCLLLHLLDWSFAPSLISHHFLYSWFLQISFWFPLSRFFIAFNLVCTYFLVGYGLNQCRHLGVSSQL